ncbi:nuclear transport factor 2 family protein [Streptomyces olivaceus]|uniref:nuclear transport factor 2 family protein n=1 Tax=Streptomyces olivaceus TaxID=47716 RepID=UPI003651CEEA
MDATAESKKVVLSFFGMVDAGTDPAPLLADDLVYWIAGDPEHFPLAGSHSKEEFGRVMSVIGANMPHGLDVKIKNIVADGAQVVAETQVHGVSATGKVYENEVVFVSTVRDGRLVSVREYLDTSRAVGVLTEKAV